MDIKELFEKMYAMNAPSWSLERDPDGSYKYHATQSAFVLFEQQQIEIESLKVQLEKAQVVPEGFVLVPKEPYAYLIKHKLWNKNSQPEIYLADDFVGDDGVEREKLIVCIPLYKGEDEAQEQN